MSFAVKLNQDQSAQLKAKSLTSLTISNISLGPYQTSARLYTSTPNTNDKFLIVSLQQGKVQNYSCSIKFLIDKDEKLKFFSQNGEIHILGNYQSVQNQQKYSEAFKNLITITIKSSNHQGEKKERKKQQNSMKMRQKNAGINTRNGEQQSQSKLLTDQVKYKNEKVSKQGNKKLSLLDMVDNFKDQEEDQDEDESYSEQSQQQSSSESSKDQNKINQKGKDINQKGKIIQQEQKQSNQKNKEKGKASWIAMLEGSKQSDSESDDEQYSQKSQESEDLDDNDQNEETPEVKIKKKQKLDNQQEQSINKSKIQSSQNIKLKQKVNNRNSQLEIESHVDSESSSFEFQVPNKLPSFVTKK